MTFKSNSNSLNMGNGIIFQNGQYITDHKEIIALIKKDSMFGTPELYIEDEDKEEPDPEPEQKATPKKGKK